MLFKVSAFTALFLFGSLGIFSSTYYCTLHLEPLGERDHQWMEIPVKKHFWIPIQNFMDYARSAVSAYHCELI